MGRIVKGINSVVHIVLILFMVELVITVFLQISFRFILDRPLAWTEELSRYSMVWITFLGAAYALSKRAHIGMELVVERAKGFVKIGCIILAALISLVFFVLMIKEGITLSLQVMNQPSAVLQIPMGIVYSIMPISGIILAINLIDVTISRVKEEGSAK